MRPHSPCRSFVYRSFILVVAFALSATTTAVAASWISVSSGALSDNGSDVPVLVPAPSGPKKPWPHDDIEVATSCSDDAIKTEAATTKAAAKARDFSKLEVSAKNYGEKMVVCFDTYSRPQYLLAEAFFYNSTAAGFLADGKRSEAIRFVTLSENALTQLNEYELPTNISVAANDIHADNTRFRAQAER